MKTEIVTLEQASQLKGKKALELFSSPENIKPIIDSVKHEVLSIVPDVATKKGRDQIGALALKVSKSRGLLVDAIKMAISDQEAIVAKAKSTIKYIESEFNETRKQILAPRDAWQAEQARIEAERVSEIRERIDNIKSLCILKGNEKKEDIAAMIDVLSAMDLTNNFDEFTSEAARAIHDGIKSLNDRIMQIIESEQAADAQRKLDDEREKGLISDRLLNLATIPNNFFGKSSKKIQAEIERLQSYSPSIEDFNSRINEAITSKNNVIAQLTMMLEQQIKLEPQEQDEDIALQIPPESIEDSNAKVITEHLSSIDTKPSTRELIELLSECLNHIEDSELSNRIIDVIRRNESNNQQVNNESYL